MLFETVAILREKKGTEPDSEIEETIIVPLTASLAVDEQAAVFSFIINNSDKLKAHSAKDVQILVRPFVTVE